MNKLLNNIKNVNKLPPYPLRRITRNIETGEYYAEKASILQLRKCVVKQLNLLMSYKI